jgi:hypothetical protein
MINQPLVQSEAVASKLPAHSKSVRDLKYFRHIVEHTLHNVEEVINLQVRSEEEAVEDALDNLLIRLQQIVSKEAPTALDASA